MKKRLAQPYEKCTTPLRMVICFRHVSVHRERETCTQPREAMK